MRKQKPRGREQKPKGWRRDMNMISMRFAESCFLSFSVFSLDIFAKEDYSILVRYLWARGSAGRAPRSQRGGRGFEPLRVHHHERSRVFALLFSCRKLSRRGSKPQGSAGGGTVRWTVEPALVRDLREAGRRRKGRGSGPVDPFGASLHPEILHIALVS